MQVTIAKKPAWRERVPRWLPAGGWAVFLFLLNAFLCRELFTAEFTVRMESIEGSYMAFSHWIGSHSNLGWRDGDNAVYSLNRRSQSLAHVLEPGQIVSEPPANGPMVEGLVRYVGAIEALGAPRAGFQWLDTNHARLNAQIKSGQLVSVQIGYSPGWLATVLGKPQPTSSDALGLLVVRPDCIGDCTIDLKWSPGAEGRWTVLAMALGLLALLVWTALYGRLRASGDHKSTYGH